jgi:hypothetical protein
VGATPTLPPGATTRTGKQVVNQNSAQGGLPARGVRSQSKADTAPFELVVQESPPPSPAPSRPPPPKSIYEPF